MLVLTPEGHEETTGGSPIPIERVRAAADHPSSARRVARSLVGVTGGDRGGKVGRIAGDEIVDSRSLGGKALRRVPDIVLAERHGPKEGVLVKGRQMDMVEEVGGGLCQLVSLKAPEASVEMR